MEHVWDIQWQHIDGSLLRRIEHQVLMMGGAGLVLYPAGCVTACIDVMNVLNHVITGLLGGGPGLHVAGSTYGLH
jgi:hypothetical protein